MELIPATSSGLISASAVVQGRPARLLGVLLQTDGTNAGTAIVYDNASAASGTQLCQLKQTGAALGATFHIANGIEANKGLYLSLSGTGATAIVLYSLL